MKCEKDLMEEISSTIFNYTTWSCLGLECDFSFQIYDKIMEFPMNFYGALFIYERLMIRSFNSLRPSDAYIRQ